MMRTPDDWTRITIEDKGSGFDPEVVHASRNGLGLFGIQQRLTYIGGKMEVESAPGQGTRVSLLVPPEKTRKEAPEPAADASESDGPRLAAETLLCRITVLRRLVRRAQSCLKRRSTPAVVPEIARRLSCGVVADAVV